MTHLLSLVVWGFFGAGAANVIAFAGVAIEASRLKAAGRGGDGPVLLSSLWDPFGARFIQDIYTDRHRDYDSAFISLCIRVIRVTTPLFFVFGLTLIVLSFTAP
ncbi:MAG: hypothetical protein REJ23_06065 [Brevundimonas sp.]|nr:hypothetical protein [Brevundimonas sp.]